MAKFSFRNRLFKGIQIKLQRNKFRIWEILVLLLGATILLSFHTDIALVNIMLSWKELADIKLVVKGPKKRSFWHILEEQTK